MKPDYDERGIGYFEESVFRWLGCVLFHWSHMRQIGSVILCHKCGKFWPHRKGHY